MLFFLSFSCPFLSCPGPIYFSGKLCSSAIQPEGQVIVPLELVTSFCQFPGFPHSYSVFWTKKQWLYTPTKDGSREWHPLHLLDLGSRPWLPFRHLLLYLQCLALEDHRIVPIKCSDPTPYCQVRLLLWTTLIQAGLEKLQGMFDCAHSKRA